MTDNNDQTSSSDSQEPDNRKKTDQALIKTDPAGARNGRGVNALLVIVSVLVLVAVSISSYGLYLIHQQQQQQLIANERQGDFGQALAELASSQEETAEAVNRLREAQQATSDALQRYSERERMDNLDWAMAEVEYLTIIAMQRLNLGRDQHTALAALEAAARRVKDINNPSLIPVREQLTGDINALREVPEVDTSGMALYLADLVTRAEELPLDDDSARTRTVEADATEEPVSGWRGLLSSIWEELRELVVIQREDEPPTELLAPDERYFLYQNLRLELASAREAVLRHDTRNLRASIELIQDWLERYFNTDAAAVTNIQESLQQMATVDLNPALPDISSSLESVRAWQRRQAEDGNGTAE